MAASCVERYDLDARRNRGFALDGVVGSLDGDTLEVDVNYWCRGGNNDTVTLKGLDARRHDLRRPGHDHQPCSRLLVAGDGGFAWSCGFTQAYDEGVAAGWSSPFARWSPHIDGDPVDQ